MPQADPISLSARLVFKAQPPHPVVLCSLRLQSENVLCRLRVGAGHPARSLLPATGQPCSGLASTVVFCTLIGIYPAANSARELQRRGWGRSLQLACFWGCRNPRLLHMSILHGTSRFVPISGCSGCCMVHAAIHKAVPRPD
ncbi:unnamed protein product [Eretmochelys imbricata]